jgi:Kdo2-lipid IVA lauroyltransferase/acyltransferase
MKNLIQKISLVLFKILRSILKILSESIKVLLGKIFGLVMMYVSSERKAITYENIKNSNLEYSDIEIKSIVKQSYQNLGITLVELLTIDTYDYKSSKPKVNYSNIEIIKKAKEKGKGVILLSGHFGNWELLAYSASILLNEALHIVIKYQMNPYTDKYLRNLRQRSGNELIDMNKAGLTMVKAIKNNSIIAMLADQRARKNEGLELMFLGKVARTYKAPALLALKFGTPIIVGFAVRDTDHNYNVELVELDHSDLEDNAEGIEELTKRYLRLLENAIKKDPGLWAWQHNRWKLN